MSNVQKWLIGIAIVVVLCACAGVVTFLVVREAGTQVAQSFKTDPTGVAQVSERIADFELPPDYSSSAGMSILTYDFVMYTPLNTQKGMIILLMQFKGGTTYTQQQMQQALERQSGQRTANVTVVKTYTATLRGQASTVVVQDSDASQGVILRQLFTVFPGKGGEVMLMIEGPRQSWDQSLADTFMASIR